MSLGSLEIRQFSPADDIEAELDLRRRSFGPLSPGAKPGWLASMQASVDDGHMTGVFDGGRLVGSARYLPMRQWWHGRSIPMAGVAGVKVAPEERGRGVGTAMMTRLLEEIAGHGYPVSALYPTTAPVYRSAGWELAGGKYEIVVAAKSLASLRPAGEASGSAPKLRRATPADGQAIIEVKSKVHQELRHHGPNTRAPATLRSWLDDENHFAYLAEDGFLSYRWAAGTAEIEVEELIATSAATACEFWQILASHATMAERVRACLAPDDPVGWLSRDPAATLRRRERWMLRIVDAPAAIAGRGYPAAASLSVPLDLTDAALPANSGHWMLEVSAGTADLRRTGDFGTNGARSDSGAGSLRLGPRGFAALYSGVPLATLRLAGLAAGGTGEDDDALDSVFAGHAFMIDYF
jgi:predicted acetyltransferase